MSVLKFIHRRLLWPIIAVTLFALASCMTSLKDDAPGSVIQTNQSAYGNYLAARYATATNDVQAASEYFSAALEQEPDNELLLQNSFLSAVLAGDLAKGAQIARPVLGLDSEDRLMRLSVGVDDIARKRFSSAEKVLSEGEYGPFNAIIGKLLHAWAAFGAGDVEQALALLDDQAAAAAFSNSIVLSRAIMLDLAGRNEAASAAYKTAMLSRQILDRAMVTYGLFLERQGRMDEARLQYETALKTFGESPLATDALARMDGGKPAQLPKRLIRTARDGAAESLFGTAQILIAQRHYDRALVYLEMARHIKPDHGAATNLLASLMEVMERPEDALLTYDTVAQRSVYRQQADVQKGGLLFRMERTEEALALYRRLLESAPENVRLLAAYADALRATKAYEMALPLYEQLVANSGENADWRLYFARGSVLERLGRWRESVADFQKALELNAEQPDVLNYLGYMYIDAGENLEDGMEMIERALILRPDAGFIVDSLGWAHYRLGNYEQAVRYLERAVEMEPGETAISDHLGDAYWQTGRHLEARFQWRHTLTLDASDDVDFKAVEQKLAHGLRDTSTLAAVDP